MIDPVYARDLLTRYKAVTTKRMERWRADPVAWLHEHMEFGDDAPAPYQERILDTLASAGRVVVRAPRGAGKTAPAAWATLWWSLIHDDDWKVPTTAGSWMQLSRFLWPEIHKWSRRLRWDRLGRDPFLRTELMTLRLDVNGGEAFAINSDDPALLEGAHARSLLAVVDEGKSVPDGSWDAVEGYFSDPGDKLALALSTPSAPAGRFFDISTRRPGFEEWTPVVVSIEEAIAAGRVDPKWVDARKAQWGEDSQLFRSHVLAEFAGEPDGVIPLAWVEAAIERRTGVGTVDRVGLDVSDGGEDDTVAAPRSGNEILPLVRWSDLDTMGTAERVHARWDCEIVVDSIGVGAGVYSRLGQLKDDKNVRGFVASEGTKRRDSSGEMGFVNKRAAAWWNLRELLEPPSELALPDDPMLIGDLTAPRWREAAGGRIQIESKDEIRKRLGRSTDSGDACVMAMWDEFASLDGWLAL